MISVNEDSLALLKYLDQIGLKIGSRIVVKQRIAFDESMQVKIDNNESLNLSKKVTQNIGVKFNSRSL